MKLYPSGYETKRQYARLKRMIDSAGLSWVSGESAPARVAITRVFNFGTLEEWRRMKKQYSETEIRQALEKPLRGQWTKRAKRFAEVLYDIRLPNDVLISYDV